MGAPARILLNNGHPLSGQRTRRYQSRRDPLTQSLCSPSGRWVFQDWAVGGGDAQPAAAGQGGHVGPEELSALVGLGAAVLAAGLGVGAAGRCGRRGGQRGGGCVLEVLLPQQQPCR